MARQEWPGGLGGKKESWQRLSGRGASHRSFGNPPNPGEKGGQSMALDEQRPYDWRGRAFHLAWKLDRAHTAAQILGTALDEGDPLATRRHYRAAREAVGSVAKEVKTLRCEQPPTEWLKEQGATGPTLVIRGSWSATVALAVMVDAMTTLSVTREVDDTDVLIGACIDAERAYEDSTAVVKAASQAYGSALGDLERAFDTEGEVALRKRVTAGRAAVHTISERVRRSRRRKSET